MVKNLLATAGNRHRFNLWVGKIPWSRKWQPVPAFLPGESRGQRSLAGYSPEGLKEVGVAEAVEHACGAMESQTCL